MIEVLIYHFVVAALPIGGVIVAMAQVMKAAPMLDERYGL